MARPASAVEPPLRQPTASSRAPAQVASAIPDDVPRVELSGRLVVTYVERPGPAGNAPGTGHGEPEIRYDVVTDAADRVRLEGELPADAATGDPFTGEVAVPDAVVAELAPTLATDLAAAAPGTALAEEEPATQAVLQVAALEQVALPVAEADVATSDATAASPAGHELLIAVVSPPGVTGTWYTDAQLTALQGGPDYWRTNSNGAIPSFPTTQVLRYASSLACDVDPFIRWDEALDAFGFGGTSQDFLFPPTATHLAVVLPPECEATAGIGLGTVGDDVHDGGLTLISVGSDLDTKTLAHELGHNLGLGHSNVAFCDTAMAQCPEIEYADFYDVMGIGVEGYGSLEFPNVRNSFALGFLGEKDLAVYELPARTGRITFDVQLWPVHSPGSVRAAMVVDPITGEPVFLEHRSGENSSFYNSVHGIEFEPGYRLNATSGVRMTASTADNGTSTIARNVSAGAYAAAIKIGETIRNPSGSISVKFVGTGGANALLRVTLSGTMPETRPVYRFYSPTYRAHFYTMDVGERDRLIARSAKTWTYEGPRMRAFATKVPGSVPLYRYWSKRYRSHFFTADPAEKKRVDGYADDLWKPEGIAFYVYPSNTPVTAASQVARFWRPNVKHHFYTADVAEADGLIRKNRPDLWRYEGTVFRVPNW